MFVLYCGRTQWSTYLCIKHSLFLWCCPGFQCPGPGFSFASTCTIFWGKFTLIIGKRTPPSLFLPQKIPTFFPECLNFFLFEGCHSERQCFRWALSGRLMLSLLKILGLGTPCFCMVQKIVVSDPTLWVLLWYKYFNYDNVWIGEAETKFKWFPRFNDIKLIRLKPMLSALDLLSSCILKPNENILFSREYCFTRKFLVINHLK